MSPSASSIFGTMIERVVRVWFALSFMISSSGHKEVLHLTLEPVGRSHGMAEAGDDSDKARNSAVIGRCHLTYSQVAREGGNMYDRPGGII